MSKYIKNIIFFVVILSIIFIFNIENKKSSIEMVKIEVRGVVLDVEISKTNEETALGLGGRPNLGGIDGMFFVFPFEARYGIWMKNMEFSIDIVWIDSLYRIVGIENNVSPKTYPNIYTPEKKVRFVLELRAGRAKELNIMLGDKIILYK